MADVYALIPASFQPPVAEEVEPGEVASCPLPLPPIPSSTTALPAETQSRLDSQLKLPLMEYQQHAVKWMISREEEPALPAKDSEQSRFAQVRGGILADQVSTWMDADYVIDLELTGGTIDGPR